MWHAELGRGLLDVWTGHAPPRRAAARPAGRRRAVVRPLRAAGLAAAARPHRRPPRWRRRCCAPSPGWTARRSPRRPRWPAAGPRGRRRRPAPVETTYCAEVVAATYQAMGLLDADRPTNYYDPGSFWSGDQLELLQGRGSATRSGSSSSDPPTPPSRRERTSRPGRVGANARLDPVESARTHVSTRRVGRTHADPPVGANAGLGAVPRAHAVSVSPGERLPDARPGAVTA